MMSDNMHSPKGAAKTAEPKEKIHASQAHAHQAAYASIRAISESTGKPIHEVLANLRKIARS